MGGNQASRTKGGYLKCIKVIHLFFPTTMKEQCLRFKYISQDAEHNIPTLISNVIQQDDEYRCATTHVGMDDGKQED